MNTVIIFSINVLLLLMAFACQFDTRRPTSTRLKYKYRVKDNSILRKIIKFKDKQFYPANYFKIIPIYLYIIFSIISFVFLIIDISTNFCISNTYQSVLIIVGFCIIATSLLYTITMIIWWELIDYLERKKPKEEKK